MIWGLTTANFTLLHMALSLLGIGAGLVVLFGLIGGKQSGTWTRLFVGTTAASVITGFAFPLPGITPAVVFGVLTTIALALAMLLPASRYAVAPGARSNGIGS